MKWNRLFIMVAPLCLAACGQFEAPLHTSSPDSVEIPQTKVENQNKAGFCWAYAGVGLIESDYKLRKSKELNLSEEALAFYRMAEGLYFLTQNLEGVQLQTAIVRGTLEGWLLEADEAFPDTFDLIQKYGVFPESVWNVKFTTASQMEDLEYAIKNKMVRLIKAQDPKKITVQQIIQNALLAAGAWDSAPPANFVVDQKSYTPFTYLSAIGFKPETYKAVAVSEPKDLDKLIAAAKRALVRGVSVPLGFPVNFDRLKVDTFSGKGVDLNRISNFFRDGGHAVLINDFVNMGSREGALPLADVLREYLRPSKDLSHFVFKNSWGTDAKTNEAGHVIEGSKTGYYKIDQDYLTGVANMTVDPDYKEFLTVVVPLDIAKDPFGTEAVNPVIALQ